MHEKVEIQKDLVQFLAERPVGPYSRVQEDGSVDRGYWHKPDHTGPDTCAGCAIEEALNTAR